MRPMVVGDRLWVFSQSPGAPPTPLQSVMLSNPPLAPPAVGHLRPTSDIMMARSALMARGQIMPGYTGPNKPISPSPYLNRLQPYKPAFGPLLTPRLKPDIYDFHNYKYLGHEPPSFVAASTTDSGIKELEKAFGNPESVYGGELGENKLSDDKEMVQCEENIEVNEESTRDTGENVRIMLNNNSKV